MNLGESFCLELLKQGLIRLVSSGTEIEVYHRGHRKWITKIPNHWKGRARYQFASNRSTVYANRLIWMLVHQRPIPDDCVVDHIDGDRSNDSPANLRLMPLTESHRQGNGVQADNILQQLSRWFAFVGEYLREPESLDEQSWVEFGF